MSAFSTTTPLHRLSSRLPYKPSLRFGHQPVPIQQQLKQGAFHIGLCALASTLGHFCLGETSHELAAHLAQAPWFQTMVEWITPSATAAPRMFGGEMAATHQAAHNVSHIAIGCVGPTAVLETAAIIAPRISQKTRSLWQKLGIGMHGRAPKAENPSPPISKNPLINKVA
ncbi:MAG: hypothetical protein U0003_01900 [Vampirovibrionales bacterium]